MPTLIITLVLTLFSHSALAKDIKVQLEEPLKLESAAIAKGSLKGIVPEDIAVDGVRLLGRASTTVDDKRGKKTIVTWFGVEKKKRYGTHREVVAIPKGQQGVYVFDSEPDLKVSPKSRKLALKTDKKVIEKAVRDLLAGKNISTGAVSLSTRPPISDKRHVLLADAAKKVAPSQKKKKTTKQQQVDDNGKAKDKTAGFSNGERIGGRGSARRTAHSSTPQHGLSSTQERLKLGTTPPGGGSGGGKGGGSSTAGSSKKNAQDTTGNPRPGFDEDGNPLPGYGPDGQPLSKKGSGDRGYGDGSTLSGSESLDEQSALGSALGSVTGAGRGASMSGGGAEDDLDGSESFEDSEENAIQPQRIVRQSRDADVDGAVGGGGSEDAFANERLGVHLGSLDTTSGVASLDGNLSEDGQSIEFDGHDELNLPTIREVSTASGCHVRVDIPHRRVVVQKKLFIYKDDVLTNPDAPCRDTLESYPLEKDFLYHDGQSAARVDNTHNRALDKYRWYYLGNEEVPQKHYVSGVLEDEAEAHPFIHEPCSPEIDLGRNKAYPRHEVVFYNRFNDRKVVNACARTPDVPAIDIIETASGCAMQHDYVQNKSWIKKKKFYEKDGEKHIVKTCSAVEPAINHQFESTTCEPKVMGDQVRVMARRKISTPDGEQYLTPCEPVDTTGLLATSDGCDPVLTHDFGSDKSYVNKRLYFVDKGERRYVSGCSRSDEVINHAHRTVGYQFDDANLRAKPKKVTEIFFGRETVQLVDSRVMPQEPWIAYRKARETISQTERTHYRGCFKYRVRDKIGTFLRPDGTQLSKVVGQADPIQGPNECRSETKHKAKFSGTYTAYWSSNDGSHQEMRGKWNISKHTLRFYPPDFSRKEVVGGTSLGTVDGPIGGQRFAVTYNYGTGGAYWAFCSRVGGRYTGKISFPRALSCTVFDSTDGGLWCNY